MANGISACVQAMQSSNVDPSLNFFLTPTGLQ
jgi:hypothetical protein